MGLNCRRPPFEGEFSSPRASTPGSPGVPRGPRAELHFFNYDSDMPTAIKEQAIQGVQTTDGTPSGLRSENGERSRCAMRHGVWNQRPTLRCDRQSRRGKGLRSHHDGIPRPTRRQRPSDWQRNAESAHTLQDPRTGVPLNVGEARRSPGLRDPGRGIPATVKPGLLSGNAGVTLLPHRDS